MELKTFFVKRVMMSFFVSVPCITAAMALIGTTSVPEARFGYEAFWSPLLFGAIASLPLFVYYSRRELSVLQTLLRSVLHLLLLEVLILTVLSLAGVLTSFSMGVSLGLSILLIDCTVQLVLWVHDSRIAAAFNQALKRMQNQASAGAETGSELQD